MTPENSNVSAIAILFTNVTKEKKQLEVILRKLETSDPGNDMKEEHRVMGLANEVARDLSLLESKLRYLSPNDNKQMWQRRTDRLADEISSLIASVHQRTNAVSRNLEQRQKDALLDSEMSSFSKRNELRRRQDAGGLLAEEASKLEMSGVIVDEMISQGSAIVQNLSTQNKILKSTQAKMKNVMISMGLSGAVIRSIRSRIRTDRNLVYGGMIVTLMVIYLCFCFTQRLHPFWFVPRFMWPAFDWMSKIKK